MAEILTDLVESFLLVVALVEFLRHWCGMRRYIPGKLVVPLTILCSMPYTMNKVATRQAEEAQREDLARTVRELRRELSAGAGKVEAVEGGPVVLPSARAVELAQLIGPNDGPYALGLKAMAERRYDDARGFLAQAEGGSTDLRTLYVARADLEGYAGAHAEQIKWLDRALQIGPDDPELLIEKGAALMALGKFGEAEAPLQHVVESSADQSMVALAQDDLGCAYLRQGNYEKAKVLNDKALETWEKERGPDDGSVGWALTNAAGIEEAAGHGQQAEERLQQALKIQKESCPEGADRARTLNVLGALYRRWQFYGGGEGIE
jgi:tetratricopeptide (TPR) repeat protein